MSCLSGLALAIPGAENHYHQAHVELLLASYQRLLHKPLLLARDQSLGQQVYQAGFALLSHNTDADPLFNYANRTALELFEFSWSELIGLPSRYSVEADNQQKRQQLLDQVGERGYMEQYSGVRIAKSGRRFFINNVVLWNVYDDQGTHHGLAACFDDWAFLP